MKLTPMLEQYFEIKRQAGDAILFYRLGDFYEMFFEDAQTAAPILDLVLTARGKGGDWEAPMCGVPHHAVDQYIPKLIRAGFRVAVCEQVTDPSEGKGLVKREIIRTITPGTAVEGSILDRESCYLLSLAHSIDSYAAAYLDVSTGDFFVKTYGVSDDARLRDDIARFNPREAVFAREEESRFTQPMKALGLAATPVEASFFEYDGAVEFLTRHFATQSLRGYGLEENDPRITAAGGALRYAVTSRKSELAHVRSIRVDDDADALLLDASTLENLEVFDSRDASRPRASLWSVVNLTRTAMGTRALRRWLVRPLRKPEAIFERHDAVDELTQNRPLLDAICAKLAEIADLERIVSRISVGLATPRECLTLADSLTSAGELRATMASLAGPLLGAIRERIQTAADTISRITGTIDPNPSNSVRDGGVIVKGIHAELDALRAIAHDSKSILLRIETDERTRTGIPSLKVRFNSVFGYYIEISKSNLAKVPPEYIRKQTLVNAERYITPELKELEEKIVGAEEKSIAIEIGIYDELLAQLSTESALIMGIAGAIADIDALASLAQVAIRNRYVRPTISEDVEICIRDGRHPVIETLSSERFIPNDTNVRRTDNEIQLITGPNMGGKSTYLRQVALIVLLNQIGSFVPAAEARLGTFDRVFTRVGASDHLARGESTFMVEMHETANILNNATNHSLIILDEVGRGTATFDGLSLAWAIVEYLHDAAERNAITFFATHYHELTDLSKTRARVANLNVTVKEWNDQIIFLRKVVPGAADKSYGIQVAKLAGIPPSVITRAREILETLERKERAVVEETSHAPRRPDASTRQQMSLFDSREESVLRELRTVELDAMSPIEALNKLNELRKKLTE